MLLILRVLRKERCIREPRLADGDSLGQYIFDLILLAVTIYVIY